MNSPRSDWCLLLSPDDPETNSLQSLPVATLFEILVSLLVPETSKAENKGNTLLSRLKTEFHSFAALLSAGMPELQNCPKDERTFFIYLCLFREAAQRYNHAPLLADNPLDNETGLRHYLIARMAWEPVEQFRILFFDRKRRFICDEVQSRGTFNHTSVYPREIARRCLAEKARYVILVHNHPSGDPSPSESDVLTTQQVKMALTLFHVQIIDHYIITRSGQSSFRELGLLHPEEV